MKVDLWHLAEDRCVTVGNFVWIWHEGDILWGGIGDNSYGGNTFGNNDPSKIEIAKMVNGMWVAPDGQEYTDWDAQMEEPPMVSIKEMPALRFGLADLIEVANTLMDPPMVQEGEYASGILDLLVRLLETDQGQVHFEEGVTTGERRNRVRKMLGWLEGS